MLLSFAALAVGAAWFLRRLRAELSVLRSEAGAQLAERNADVDRRLEAMTSTLDRRLESTSQSTGEIQRRLGELGRANEEILARANDLKRLEQALRPPKARGGFGELLLENLLRDRLPPTAFALQHGFAGGERVDAVIKVDRLVPIDSKFPLDNFERMLGGENDIERQQFEKLFARDVKHHVDAIAVEVHPARRGDVRLRIHVPPIGGDLLRARLREDRRAARLRARQARPSRFLRRR